MGWIRIRMDLELGKFKAGSRSGINHSGSATLIISLIVPVASVIFAEINNVNARLLYCQVLNVCCNFSH